MRKIEMNIYKFKELKEEVQKKLLDDFRNDLIDANFNYLEEELNHVLTNDYNLNDFNISYSLSYSQGDGVCFYNKNINILNYYILKNNDYQKANAFEKYVLDNYKNSEDFYKLLEFLNFSNRIYIEREYTNYSHYNTCKIDYDCYSTDEIIDFVYELSRELKKNVYIPICEKLEEIGYKCYDVSDDKVLEYITYNEYEFYEDGNIYRC